MIHIGYIQDAPGLTDVSAEHKHRLLPKHTLLIAGIAAIIGTSGVVYDHHGKDLLQRHRLNDSYAAFALDNGFEVIFRNNDAYTFFGAFRGVYEEDTFTAVGGETSEGCFVTILRNGPVTTLRDTNISPKFIISVDEKSIDYYILTYDELVFKTYDRTTQDTHIRTTMLRPISFWNESKGDCET